MIPTMPFGKYQGQPVAQLPLDYAKWCVQTLSDGWLRRQIQIDLKGRKAERKEAKRREHRTLYKKASKRSKGIICEVNGLGQPTRISYGLAPIHYRGPIIDDGTIPFKPNC